MNRHTQLQQSLAAVDENRRSLLKSLTEMQDEHENLKNNTVKKIQLDLEQRNKQVQLLGDALTKLKGEYQELIQEYSILKKNFSISNQENKINKQQLDEVNIEMVSLINRNEALKDSHASFQQLQKHAAQQELDFKNGQIVQQKLEIMLQEIQKSERNLLEKNKVLNSKLESAEETYRTNLKQCTSI